MADSMRGGDHFAFDKWRMGWLADSQVRCVIGGLANELRPVAGRDEGRRQGRHPADRPPDRGRRRIPDAPGRRRVDLLDRRIDLQGQQWPGWRRRPCSRLGCATALRTIERLLLRRAGRRGLQARRPLDRLRVRSRDRRHLSRQRRPHQRRPDEDVHAAVPARAVDHGEPRPQRRRDRDPDRRPRRVRRVHDLHRGATDDPSGIQGRRVVDDPHRQHRHREQLDVHVDPARPAPRIACSLRTSTRRPTTAWPRQVRHSIPA